MGRASETLFDKAILRQHAITVHQRTLATAATPLTIQNWIRTLGESTPKVGKTAKKGARKALNESNLEQSFNSTILGGVFGYTLPGTTDSEYTLLPKEASASGIPDAMLGIFGGDQFTSLGTVELKQPLTDLDAPQGRESKETPVEQAFRAARSSPAVRWVIVSNLDEIRLYHISQPARFYRTYLSRAVDGLTGELTPDFQAALAVIHRTQLLASDSSSASSVDNLLERTEASNTAIRGGFYDLFSQARNSLYKAILEALPDESDLSKRTALAKAQKLLDRIIFIRFCEDHPYELLKRARLEQIVRSAPQLPGRNTTKIYHACKGYFEEIRLGSAPGSTYTVFAYDGELFDDDPVLDHIDLDDSLFRERFKTTVGDRVRLITGPFGFWEYNFSTELNEHLLGHIYERSLADLERGDLPSNARVRTSSSAIRARYGIWYTPETLTSYLASVALTPILNRLYSRHVSSLPASAGKKDQREAFEAYYESILALRILDPSCGSGAFLVSCFDILAAACSGALHALEQLSDVPHPGLLDSSDSRLMHECLFGIDLNPEAVAITKLALWLKTAYKQEANVDLSDRIVSANSLDGTRHFKGVDFDVVIGNPPWGAEWSVSERAEYKKRFAFQREDIRSEEAFMRLSERYLAKGGTLAYVLPDTVLHPEKFETRKWLLDTFTILAFDQLGPEWFTAENRMATVVISAEFAQPPSDNFFRSFTLVDKDRKAAIREEFSLFQADAQYAGLIGQERCRTDGDRGYEIRLFQYETDDSLMAKILAAGVPLHRTQDGQPPLTERGRGMELNKEGLVIQCPSCSIFVSPPVWDAKNNRYGPKTCPACGHTFNFDGAVQRTIVYDRLPASAREVPYIDGESIHRYERVRYGALDLDVPGISFKAADLYADPKVLVRQAGVGINAVLDQSGAYCPQSVYIYRVREEWARQGYSNAYVVGVLSSRILHYYLFKRFGEIDSARAHVKVTHERLADMPIPALGNAAKKLLAQEISARVLSIVADPAISAKQHLDREIEDRVARLFNLTPAERAYINGQFGLVHENETIKGLFPHGVPKPQALNVDPELF